jgi:hypothetical protein
MGGSVFCGNKSYKWNFLKFSAEFSTSSALTSYIDAIKLLIRTIIYASRIERPQVLASQFLVQFSPIFTLHRK